MLISAATPAQGAALALAGFLRLAKPRHSLSVPLTQNTAKMVARLHPKWRAARKTALQRGAVARIRPFFYAARWVAFGRRSDTAQKKPL